jgi:TatD DNase family protein
VLIDAHAHLDRYGDALDAALSDIDSRRILTTSVSMDLPSWERNLAIAERSRFVIPAVGIHPWNAPEHAGRLGELDRAVSGAPVIGEIGLDHHFVEDASAYAAQREVFRFFLGAAAEQGKIVNLHTKGAEAEVLRALDDSGVSRAIVHWYSGPLGPLRDFLERGAYLTVGVHVLSSKHVRTIARTIPDDLLLTETDNPGGAEWLTGDPGMPALLEAVVAALAEIRQTTPDDIVRTVSRNFLRLIDDDPRLAAARDLLEEAAPADAAGQRSRSGGPS